MTAWPKDDMAAKIAFYGDPRGPHGENPKWRASVEKRITAPFQMYYAGEPIKTITVHKKIADAVLAAFNEIWDACGHDQHKVDATGASDFAGCFNYRVIAGTHNLSNHSWGCAIDLSPKTNGFHAGHGTISNIVVDAFKRQGAFWGGDYKGRTDPMHFEFVDRGQSVTRAAVKPADPERPALQRPTLRYGDKGEDVKLAQRLLGIKEDGDFGSATYAAVREFQRVHKIAVIDGIVGPKTWIALERTAT